MLPRTLTSWVLPQGIDLIGTPLGGFKLLVSNYPWVGLHMDIKLLVSMGYKFEV